MASGTLECSITVFIKYNAQRSTVTTTLRLTGNSISIDSTENDTEDEKRVETIRSA